MTPILGTAGLAALARFAGPDTLVALDYDGTLAPIVPDPRNARMRERTHHLLVQLTHRFPTVVITGRSRHDLLRLMAGIPSLQVIGNHGLETDSVSGARYAKRVQQWQTTLAPRLASLPGMVVENKRYSLSIHYRHCPDPPAAAAAVERAAEDLEGVRRIGGKQVINLVPAEAPDKGRALLAACVRLGCPRAIYVGDDDTDEDVFALRRPDTLLTVRVGCSADSSAAWCLGNQDDVDEFLSALAAAASPARHPRTAN